jgi:hypothetical protein
MSYSLINEIGQLIPSDLQEFFHGSSHLEDNEIASINDGDLPFYGERIAVSASTFWLITLVKYLQIKCLD